MPSSRQLTAETFAGHEGSTFTIVAGEERRELRLKAVEPHPRLLASARNPDGTPIDLPMPFSLKFSGPREELFGQATFEIEHAVLGRLVIFVKPFAEHGDRAYYESIFS